MQFCISAVASGARYSLAQDANTTDGVIAQHLLRQQISPADPTAACRKPLDAITVEAVLPHIDRKLHLVLLCTGDTCHSTRSGSAPQGLHFGLDHLIDSQTYLLQ